MNELSIQEIRNKISCTVDEAALLLSVSDKQIRDWINNEPSFPCLKIGNKRSKNIINVEMLNDFNKRRIEQHMSSAPILTKNGGDFFDL